MTTARHPSRHRIRLTGRLGSTTANYVLVQARPWLHGHGAVPFGALDQTHLEGAYKLDEGDAAHVQHAIASYELELGRRGLALATRAFASWLDGGEPDSNQTGAFLDHLRAEGFAYVR